MILVMARLFFALFLCAVVTPALAGNVFAPSVPGCANEHVEQKHEHSQNHNCDCDHEREATDCPQHSARHHCAHQHSCCANPVLISGASILISLIPGRSVQDEFRPRNFSEPLLDGPFQPPRYASRA
jgi:hypothetical protein